MSITIPKNIDVSESRDATIAFHRHCQKTICSAYGYNGTGATKTTISTITSADVRGLISNWKDYFNSNSTEGSNITDDLAAILKIISATALAIQPSVSPSYIKFTDNNTTSTSSYSITPGETTEIPIGRLVELKVNNETAFKFHTLRKASNEILEYNLNVSPEPPRIFFQDYEPGSPSVYSLPFDTPTAINIGRTVNLQINSKPAFQFHTLKEDSGSYNLISNQSVNINYRDQTTPLNIGHGLGSQIYTFPYDCIRTPSTTSTFYNDLVSWDKTNKVLTIKPNQKYRTYKAIFYNEPQINHVMLDINDCGWVSWINEGRGSIIFDFDVLIHNWGPEDVDVPSNWTKNTEQRPLVVMTNDRYQDSEGHSIYDFLQIMNMKNLRQISSENESIYQPQGSETWETLTYRYWLRTYLPNTDAVSIDYGKAALFHVTLNSWQIYAIWEYKYQFTAGATSGAMINQAPNI